MYLNICVSFKKPYEITTKCVCDNDSVFTNFWPIVESDLVNSSSPKFFKCFSRNFCDFFSEFFLLWMVILWILQLCWKHRISLFVRCGLGIFSLCLLTEPKWAWRQLSQNLMRCPSRSKRGDSNTDVNWDFP